MMQNYFLDTYALIEIIKGNNKYTKYTKFSDFNLFTSIFNLYELYYKLLKDYNEEIAKRYFLQFKQILLEIKDEYIFLASKFRLQNIKKDFSYTDALGYIMARENNMKFLTGDKEFKDLDNVEFVPR